MQQLYQSSNHPFISEAIFAPVTTIIKSCNKNKIFSMTYLNSFAECCIREIEARKNVDHLAIKTYSSVLKKFCPRRITDCIFLPLAPIETLQVTSTMQCSYPSVWRLRQVINSNLSLTDLRNLTLFLLTSGHLHIMTQDRRYSVNNS